MTRQIQTPGAAPDADPTRDQLRAQLDALGIAYTTRDTKPELQAKLDAAQQPKSDDSPPQDEPDYPALIATYQRRIFELTAENADLREKLAEREAPINAAAPSKAPAPQLTGMVLTDQGYVVG